MPVLSRLAVAFLCIATSWPAAAQQQKSPVTDCAGLLARAAPLVEVTPESKIEPIETGCRATNIFFSQSAYSRWKVAELTVAGKDLFASITADRLPETLEVSLTGLHVSLNTGTSLSKYVMEVIQLPYDIHLAYQWDRARQELTVSDFSLKGPRFGSVAISAAVSGVSKMPGLSSQPEEVAKQASLRKLSFKLFNRGVFETVIVMPLISALPHDQDPKPAIERYRSMATTFVDSLPETVATDDSKTALKTFVAEFPHPAGRYQVDIEAKQPVAVADLAGAAADPQALSALLSRFTLSAHHEPETVQ